MTQSVGVVVVTHNNESTVKACLEAIVELPSKQVVVVDHESSDSTVAIARSLPGIEIAEEKNNGFAAGVNHGVSMLRNCQYIVLLNPDTEVKDTLQPVFDAFAADPLVGVIGLGLYDEHQRLEVHGAGEEPSLMALLTKKNRTVSRNRPIDWVSGGAMVIRKDVFEKVGGFDERFFLYWEDVDFCRRLRQAGYRVLYLPLVRVIHRRGGSMGDVGRKTSTYDQSADRYFQKHYSAPIWILQRLFRFLYRQFWPQVH